MYPQFSQILLIACGLMLNAYCLMHQSSTVDCLQSTFPRHICIPRTRLNSAYPELHAYRTQICSPRTEFCIPTIQRCPWTKIISASTWLSDDDDDEDKDEDEDLDDNHNHIDILFAKRRGIRRIGSCMQTREQKRQWRLKAEPQTPRKTRARCGQCRKKLKAKRSDMERIG